MIVKISEYINQFDYDIRKTHDARFMDQKVTPDVLCIISDCVINFIGQEKDKIFTVKDIWDSEYFNTLVKDLFNKPDATNTTARREYDKFISQPLKALSYAKILECEKKGNANYYSVLNYDILEFISIKDRNAYVFLYTYLKKVLEDSGLIGSFEGYLNAFEKGRLNQSIFSILKNRFERFIIGNTKINSRTEIRRIFPKILNIFATEHNIPGTIKGQPSVYPFYYTDLMYNRKNWRDINKDKTLTRQEADNLYDKLVSEKDNAYNKYLIAKAKNII